MHCIVANVVFLKLVPCHRTKYILIRSRYLDFVFGIFKLLVFKWKNVNYCFDSVCG